MKRNEMDKLMEKKTIRLLYPQWQGGDVARWVPEVPDAGEASRGYALGARLLHFLAPQSGVETYEVPVAMGRSERKTAGDVLDRDVIAAQRGLPSTCCTWSAPIKS